MCQWSFGEKGGVSDLIHAECGIVAQDRGQPREERPGISRSADRCTLLEEVASAGGHECPDEDRDPGDRHDDTFN